MGGVGGGGSPERRGWAGLGALWGFGGMGGGIKEKLPPSNRRPDPRKGGVGGAAALRIYLFGGGGEGRGERGLCRV